MPTSLEELARALAAFNAERDWERFHTPKDLATALSIEASELLELFLWKREGELPARERLREELGDVVICLVNLAARLDVDLLAAAGEKLAKNAAKYPVARARGSAAKWDELERAAAAVPSEHPQEVADAAAHPLDAIADAAVADRPDAD